MNHVDALVKKCILNYISIFPTRMHVLSHALLSNGTGYQWTKKDDGFLYLECPYGNDDNRTTVKMNDPHEWRDGLSADQKFENHIRQWINDNIDEYCLSDFSHIHTRHMLPKLRATLMSRGYNRLQEIKNIRDIAPEWREAVAEVCGYYCTLMTETFHIDQRNALAYLRGEWRDMYLILDHARKLVHSQKDSRREIARRLTEKMFTKDRAEAELRKVDFYRKGVEELCTFEHFESTIKRVQEFNSRMYGSEVWPVAYKIIKFENEYLIDGKPSELLYSKMKDSLEYLGWNYYCERSWANRICEICEIPSFYYTIGANFLADEISANFGS